MVIVAVAVAAFCATYAGGLFALSLKDRLHLVLGFSAGSVVAVAFFDLIPESIELGRAFHAPTTLLSWVALGFLLYLILDRVHVLRGHKLHRHANDGGHSIERGIFGAASLSAHSFLDGIVIGVAFQASASVGAVVAVAVLTHDFSDGINTANIVLKNGGDRRQVVRWLLADAIAPAAGMGCAALIIVPPPVLGIVLALFGGFFLYIGASDLIPESHHAHPKLLTTATTVLGAAVLYLTTIFVNS
ncbi:MAG TPA: ZIP family metal transporter [Nevskiaceae bacterium]|nr:ZIP family metal transporter [Nevskiaceae bacterium]